ncbi:phage protein Gp37 [Pseudoxanthomonas winnipegensis]|uniref:phage protein Gp37 n=1 Tax=Pseudoxanthomonas winnipegensis TaxID=2480810 RepID=UPI00103C930F|nr:phage protein Gp37 [Pseudoxanthomonas winnipegensis]TBV76876.1 DUF1834 family protein [Pseudoxanthomonas winnipegensis]
MSIASVEQWFIDTIKGHFGSTLKGVESIPADWDDETLRRVLRQAPGVFVVFGGGPRNSVDTDDGRVVIDAKWGIVAVTAHASGELARRRGDKREIGAYDILQRTARLLEGTEVPGAGEIQVDQVENLFDAALEKQGVAVYGLALTLPMYLIPDDAEEAPLDAFKTWDNTLDSTPDNGHAEAEDHVELEQ